MMKTSCRPRSWWLAAAIIAMAPTFHQAMAQADRPNVANPLSRSGLVTRFVPPQPFLPYDKDRDTFFGTYYDDRPKPGHLHPWKLLSPLTQGLYGLPLGSPCVACVPGRFPGYAGNTQIPPECAPKPQVVRLFSNLVHPLRPVNYYYERGAYVPVYDLDPTAPGPGLFPMPFYIDGPNGG